MAFDFDKIKDTLVSAGKEVESMAKDVSAVAIDVLAVRK